MLVLLCAACVANEVVQPPGVPEAPRVSMDCTLSQNECGDIYASIQYLRGHGLPACQAMGQNALVRYNASGYGFRPSPTYQPLRNAYVEMYENDPWEPATPSGYHAANGNVYIDQDGAAMIQEMLGGVLAHEEQHQLGNDGPAHNTGSGPSYESICQTPYP